jgi:hypothetical protein
MVFKDEEAKISCKKNKKQKKKAASKKKVENNKELGKKLYAYNTASTWPTVKKMRESQIIRLEAITPCTLER